MIYLFVFLILLCIVVTLFINLNPVFGGRPNKELYKQFDNYVNGKFVNENETEMIMGVSDIFSMIRDSIKDNNERNPASEIPVSAVDWEKIKSEKDSLTWFGHSAFLLSIDNKKLLLDPMLGKVASPVSFAGSKRYKYSENMARIFDEMPFIDAVFITHDHYDHLDYQSIIKLKNKVGCFFVPLGVGAHLVRWGVQKEKITELNWWQEGRLQDIPVALLPSKHFSGRGVFNRNTTLWGGWAIFGKNTSFYTSGDGGYGEHFNKIGDKYGPFDITLIEGAQYDRRWSSMHMMPEEAVQAHLNVKGKNMMLMHWGAFTLAFHGWKEPVERAIDEAKKSGVNLIAPKVGETVILESDLKNQFSAWWDY
ncbi:MBL fold metallo-hydrolase [Clostridium sp. YIM B02505]|uniref:MBL fold metallo-hydrolase n=1 Tax=Clostridium yunnanense TaxID=2800325 RepID=A0ABS1EU36_9CLOT|nr:MBL fold metallo-hydrolase [Clostridium yunnanense]MBK1812825.1 MBL fold metallo-hydrolase [Clostridium yunnanense]